MFCLYIGKCKSENWPSSIFDCTIFVANLSCNNIVSPIYLCKFSKIVNEVTMIIFCMIAMRIDDSICNNPFGYY